MKRVKCCDCGVMASKPKLYKGKLLCRKCYVKNVNIIGGRQKVSLVEALEREYVVRLSVCKKTGQCRSGLSLPWVLGGRKVKVVLVEDAS